MPDILLTPTNPISSSFHVKGLTCEGRKFVAREIPSGMITGHNAVDTFKILAYSQGLVMSTDWTCAGRAMAS
jgi:hypothetical protein